VYKDIGDHLHEDLAFENDSIVPTTDFQWDEVDRNVFDVEDEEDDTVSFSDMAACLALIVQWACASPDIKHVGGRIAALGVLLDPTNLPHNRRTLADVARETGVTRAAVSKWALDFRDQVGTSLTVGKRSSVRTKDSAAQLAALERGTHSSQVKRAKKSG
jgi:hypothetical protein